MAAFVLANLAQLRRRQAREPLADLTGGQVVVVADRKRVADSDGPPSHGSDLIAPAADQALYVFEQIVGLLAAAVDELRHQVVGIGPGDSTPGGGLIEYLLDSLAGEQQQPERV